MGRGAAARGRWHHAPHAGERHHVAQKTNWRSIARTSGETVSGRRQGGREKEPGRGGGVARRKERTSGMKKGHGEQDGIG